MEQRYSTRQEQQSQSVEQYVRRIKNLERQNAKLHIKIDKLNKKVSTSQELMKQSMVASVQREIISDLREEKK